MTRSQKYLSLSVIFSTAIAITGCIVTPTAQNQPAANTNSYYNQNSAPVNVSDLNNSSASYAEQQLQARGFNQTRSIPPSNGFSNSWWLNSRTNQCFQLETANGKVMTLNPRTSQDLPQFRCNQNDNQDPGYGNNVGQPVPGQTPAALNDFIGSKAGQAEGDLVRRGYVLRKTAGLNSYWEETATGGCVSIVTNDGRYQSLVYTTPQACR
jgi:hypothetical protein